MKPKWFKREKYFRNPVTNTWFKATHELRMKTDKGWNCFLHKGISIYVTSRIINISKSQYVGSSNDRIITKNVFNKKLKDSIRAIKKLYA